MLISIDASRFLAELRFLFRAPGMSTTAYLNLAMVLFVLYCTFVRA